MPCPTATLLEERLGLALENADENGTSVAPAYLDLDRFEPVNDVHGHAAGYALPEHDPESRQPPFGTMLYSSLSDLQRFRFDTIKVDRSFVRRLGQHADALTIVRAITHLGHNLGLKVTVDGVETQEQLAVLRELGCDQMQGDLFARPAPMTNLSETGPSGRGRLRALFSDEAARACA